MKENSSMSISEFAALTGMKRANLIFYDRIGLLSPEHRAENNYRRYSQRQLGTAYLIAELREMGIGIEEIKSYTASRTPEVMVELFQTQERRIQAEIEKLRRLKGMLQLYLEMAADVPVTDMDTIRVVEKAREPIFLGQPTTELKAREEKDLQDFYDYIETHSTEYYYPLGGIRSRENLLRGRYEIVGRYYLRLPFASKDYKPAGRYVTGYIQSDYGKAGALYLRLMQYIEQHGLVICGNAYEECPLNEVSFQSAEDYITKVEILVE